MKKAKNHRESKKRLFIRSILMCFSPFSFISISLATASSPQPASFACVCVCGGGRRRWKATVKSNNESSSNKKKQNDRERVNVAIEHLVERGGEWGETGQRQTRDPLRYPSSTTSSWVASLPRCVSWMMMFLCVVVAAGLGCPWFLAGHGFDLVVWTWPRALAVDSSCRRVFSCVVRILLLVLLLFFFVCLAPPPPPLPSSSS